MNNESSQNIEEAVEILQQLGLKEYEARCFVGLSRVQSGTAKLVSEMTEVPRTRVYDAIRVLEAQGLVEIQHSSPQKYRAVSPEEATKTLRSQYDTRVERLADALAPIEIIDAEEKSPVQEVWTMNGQTAIENRTNQLIRDATDEIVLVIGDSDLLTSELTAALNEMPSDAELLIGALTPSLEGDIRDSVPKATTFVSGLEWLQNNPKNGDETAIGRLLLADRSAILVSSIMSESREEQAIFGEGFENGLVVIARRIMAQGLLRVGDPTG